MAQLPSPRAKARARLEIIPFIDIMFFLLATFMMASLAMIENEGLDLELPSAYSSQPTQDLPDRITVSVTESGEIYLDKQAVTINELKGLFLKYRQENPEIAVILQGDFQSRFGNVVEVFDQARQVGLTKLVLRTQRPD
jgi:biopolymer transport protein ExbD